MEICGGFDVSGNVNGNDKGHGMLFSRSIFLHDLMSKIFGIPQILKYPLWRICTMDM